MEPYQPRNITFPKTQYKEYKRSFQSSWFDRFPWLHYNVVNDAAYCFTCVRAASENLITLSKIEQTFVTASETGKKLVRKIAGFTSTNSLIVI